MSMCSKCNTEADEDQKFCDRCGNILIEEVLPAVDETVKKNLQMCPRCRVVYEKEQSCVKCKSKLVPIMPPPGSDPVEEKEHLEIKTPEIQQENLQSLSPERDDARTRFVPDRKIEKSLPPKLPLSAKRLPGERISLFYLWGRRKKILKPVPLSLVGILILIGVVAYLSMRRSDPGASPSSGVHDLGPVVSSVPLSPTEGEGQEMEKIKAVLEKIRQANLQENIDLFMSCYTLDFADREDKKRSTLENWKILDYLDLSYSLKTVTVDDETADIEIEWLIKTTREKGGQPEENRMVIDALLKKEEGSWKIRETRTPG